MGRDTLTGSRIRERRLIVGMRQAELARLIDISASYLNLIEHNRRRIGGKLLLDIARILKVEPSMLSEGAEAALIATLKEAAADSASDTRRNTVAAETDRSEEFAGRFPGWAEVLVAGYRRIAALERTVEILSDRLTHDPQIAASLHEVLSTAASIRSTASILAESGELEQEWRDRFLQNLNQDSRRLAQSSKALVTYLDESGGDPDRSGVPQEAVEAFFAANAFHFPTIEDGSQSVAQIVEAADELTSDEARTMARATLQQYADDAVAMPLAAFTDALAQGGAQGGVQDGTQGSTQGGPDLVALARRFDTDLAPVFRRMAAMPENVLPGEVGLVVADASGSILFRKPVTGFTVPRFGASCPLWPLFSALNRPMVAIRRRVTQPGRVMARFDCMAIAWAQGTPGFERDPQYRSTMLILPVAADVDADGPAQMVGSTCRVCPRRDCNARREPSILNEGF